MRPGASAWWDPAVLWRREIKTDCFLRAASNPRRWDSLQRVITAPRKIEEKAVAALLDTAHQNNISVAGLLLGLEAGDRITILQVIGGRAAGGEVLATFWPLLQRCWNPQLFTLACL